MTAGYSGTPLARKLGYAGAVWCRAMPASVRAEIGPGPVFSEGPEGAGAAHLFHRARSELAADLVLARRVLPDTAMVWVSWPKKAARIATDITEDRVRDIALPLGFVDVKVCAVDAVWSGLKLVTRKELRQGPGARAANRES